LDAREYYPKNFDDRWLWRIFVKPLNEYLCAKYIPLCDKIITVSQGIAREYEHAYGVHAEVVMSLPRSSMLSPAAARSDRFRLIHHGSASQSRRIEDMVELMDYTDKRFSLDLMLVGDGPYMSRLRRMVERRRNVRILPPVAMQEIVPFIHQYDIGVFLCPPSNFNLKYALPNKLFEFIQARLAVAVSPSVEMRTIVEDYNCGIVSNDFSPQSMAHALNSLTSEKIAFFKNQSHKAAAKLNAEANQTRVLEIVDDLIGKG
jgi:glycosyltransferase involved in cell wall biosynthesis